MSPAHREEIREKAARRDLPEYAIRAYVEAALVDAKHPSPKAASDALQFAADLLRTLPERAPRKRALRFFDPLDFIPSPDGIKEAL